MPEAVYRTILEDVNTALRPLVTGWHSNASASCGGLINVWLGKSQAKSAKKKGSASYLTLPFF